MDPKPFIEAAWRLAAHELRKHRELIMFTVILKTSTMEFFVMPKVAHKDLFALVLSDVVEKSGADFVLLISEAWYAPIPNGQATLDKINREGVERQRGRLEVVNLEWKAASGDGGVEVRELNRTTKKDRPSLGPFILKQANTPGTMSRNFDLLFRQQKDQVH